MLRTGQADKDLMVIYGHFKVTKGTFDVTDTTVLAVYIEDVKVGARDFDKRIIAYFLNSYTMSECAVKIHELLRKKSRFHVSLFSAQYEGTKSAFQWICCLCRGHQKQINQTFQDRRL